MKFRKKPIIIEADRWFPDHPVEGVASSIPNSSFRPGDPFKGWIETLEGGHIVSPGDWIITGVTGEKYPRKPDIFEATYELVRDSRWTRFWKFFVDTNRGGSNV